MERAPRYARISLFEYPQPSRSPMKINFSCPGGILKHQVQIIKKYSLGIYRVQTTAMVLYPHDPKLNFCVTS